MLLIALAMGLSGGCLESGPAPKGIAEHIGGVAGAPADPPPEAVGPALFEAELGVTDPVTRLDFMALPDGAAIPFEGSGQAGLAARLAVRLTALSQAPVPAEVLLELEIASVESGIVAANRSGIPIRLQCRDDGSCYHVPMQVEISHLAPADERDGLLVEGRLTVRDTSDPSRLLALARCAGRLERY